MDRFLNDMTSSDKIALLALAVSLISFWLSYRSTRLSKLLSAAEKRSQAHIVLLDTLLHGQMLHSTFLKVQEKARAISALPAKDENLERVRAKIFQILDESVVDHHLLLKNIEERLESLSSENINDPVLLEKYKLHVDEINLKMKNLTSNISDLERHMNDLETHSTEVSKSSILLPD